MKNFLYVAIGGAFGATSRYGLNLLLSQFKHFPIGTFVVNSIGCLLAGYAIGLQPKESWVGTTGYLLGGVGFLGSFTTFSSVAVDGFNLFQQGKPSLVLLHFFANFVISSLMIVVGFYFSGAKV